MGDIAVKILIGIATAAVWFALSRAASAERIHDRGPGVDVCVLGVGLDIGGSSLLR
jgi:hypothetical protein